ncbi:hypothetical protein [Olivibacter sitiensis]|uniref:hypothetical protein n=1 Tax=Olivibacter sitiensis TaxID=376470 RepID=UPI00055EF5FB|nr:hypothetical protein [Olivibacter sitiensis]
MSSETTKTTTPFHHWTAFQVGLLRFAWIYFALQLIPFQPDFYRQLFNVNWNTFVIDVFQLATYTPHFFGTESTLLDWLLIASIALLGTFVWPLLAKGRQSKLDDDTRYYYLRVLVRFRLAAALFALGFIKLFPLFAPEPSLSHLNTAYGYFADLKQLYLSLGVAPAYLSFLGVIEVTTAILLLFRRTSFLAVIFIIPFYGNVFLANLAYEGKGYVFSLFLLTLAFVPFLYDFRRFVRLVIGHAHTEPAFLGQKLDEAISARVKVPLKLIFVFVLVALYGSKSYSVYTNHSSLYYPQTAGLVDAEGIYNASLFVQNRDTVAYAPNHPFRWKDVVFEKWNTLSIRSNRPVDLNELNGISLQREDSLRNYEYALVGDRHYYSYQVSEDGKKLHLQNRNPHYADEHLELDIARPDNNTIFLSGRDNKGDSLLVKLDKLDKKYLIEEVKKVGRSTLGFRL